MASDIRVLPLWMVYVYTLYFSYTVGFPTVYVLNSSTEASDTVTTNRTPGVACPATSDPVEYKPICQQTADTRVACPTGCLHWNHHEPVIRLAQSREKLALPAMHSKTWPEDSQATLSQKSLINRALLDSKFTLKRTAPI